MTRGLEAERGDRKRHPQIVVDALRHLHDANRAARGAERHRAAHHVVAADGDERVDFELRERGERVVEALRIARDVEPRRAEQHAAIEMDARHIVDRQLALLVGVALREPLESVLKADRRAAPLDRFERRRRNHPVGAGRRSAADDDADPFDAHDDS